MENTQADHLSDAPSATGDLAYLRRPRGGRRAAVPFAVSADAGPRRARLSSDLATLLASGSSGDVDVIVSGSAEKIDRVAQRHGLRIKKKLSSGAVFSGVAPGAGCSCRRIRKWTRCRATPACIRTWR